MRTPTKYSPITQKLSKSKNYVSKKSKRVTPNVDWVQFLDCEAVQTKG